jgi:hypothetical protein
MDRANPVLVHQGQSSVLTITDPVMSKIRYMENTKYSYTSSTTKSDIEAEILDFEFQVDPPEAGYQLIRKLVYTVSFTAPPEIPAGAYQLVLTVETKLYTPNISKPDDQRWRDWLANPGNLQQLQSAVQPKLIGTYKVEFHVLVVP